MTHDGAVSYFHASNRVRVLPPGLHTEADVIVVFTTEVTEETLATMRRLTSGTSPDPRIVLVADHIGEANLLRAIRYGLIGFVPRLEAGMGQVLQAVLSSQEKRAKLPDVLVKALIDQIRAVQDNVLEPHGLNLSGLKDREVDVLRLLAEGLDTTEVAVRLNYSERTIKSILSGMTLRLGLRNRAHAIAYAMRCGAL